jgi:hypothetical protein
MLDVENDSNDNTGTDNAGAGTNPTSTTPDTASVAVPNRQEGLQEGSDRHG